MKRPATLFVISQILAVFPTFFLIRVIPGWFTSVDVKPMTSIIHGCFAAGLGYVFGIRRWWVLINLVFPIALAFAIQAHLPAYVFAICGLILLSFFWNSARDRVPLYFTSSKGYGILEEILRDRNKAFRLVDLGSGFSGTLVFLSKCFPESEFVGVETAPLSFFISWIRSLIIPNLKIRYCDLWKFDLHDFDVVYCFLSPEPMPKIWKKAKSELRAGAVLISNTFSIPGKKPTYQKDLGDWRHSTIYMWKM